MAGHLSRWRAARLSGPARRQENPLASPPAQPRCPAAWDHCRSRLPVVLVSRRPITRVLERREAAAPRSGYECGADHLRVRWSERRRRVGAERRHRHLAWWWANRIGSADAGAGNRRDTEAADDAGRRGQADHSPKPVVSVRRPAIPLSIRARRSLLGRFARRWRPTKLLIADAGVQFAPPDWLLFVRQKRCSRSGSISAA